MEFSPQFLEGEHYCLKHRTQMPCTLCARDLAREYNRRLRTAVDLSNPSEAREEGMTIDRNVYPWFAYKGDRFSPDVSREVLTDYEEFLKKETEYLEEDLDRAVEEADTWMMWSIIIMIGITIGSFSLGAIMF